MYDMAAAVARLEGGIESLSAQVKTLDRRLFGNGQPGELAQIESRIGEIGGRVKALEKLKWVLSGAGIVFGALGGIIGAVVEMIFKVSK